MADQYENTTFLGPKQELATALIGRHVLYIGRFSTLPRKQSKHVLYALFILNFVYSALVFEEAFGLAVRQDRTIARIIEASYQWNLLPLISGWTSALVQVSLMLRAGRFISNVTCRWVFYVWIALLVTCVLFFSTFTSALGFLFNTKGGEAVLFFDFNRAVAIWLSCAAGCDISISLALAYSLRARIAGFNIRTDGLLKKLVWIGLRTALTTTVLSVAGAVVAAVWQDGDYATTDLNLAFWLPSLPVYCLSFFSTLSSSCRAIITTIGAPAPTLRGTRQGSLIADL
ncbi:hypothetical protein JCM8547_004653 [Rhodosporidiobolus lusitaniae]